MGKFILDAGGNVIGIMPTAINGMMLDKKGQPVARYDPGTNCTYDKMGRFVGRGDLRMVELGKHIAEESMKNKK